MRFAGKIYDTGTVYAIRLLNFEVAVSGSRKRRSKKGRGTMLRPYVYCNLL